MGTLIVVCGIGGGLLLLTATILLVRLNWSAQIWGPAISIALVGLATIFATVFTLLKQSETQSVITTSVVIDPVDGLPPMISKAGSDSSRRADRRYTELSLLTRVAVTPGDQTPNNTPTAKTNGTFTFCGELLQYYVVKQILQFQRGSSEFGFADGAAFASVRPPLKVSQLDEIPGDQLIKLVANNQFANSAREQFLLKSRRMPLPKGTRLSLLHEVPDGGKVEKYIVRLEKSLFFVIEVTIEPLGGVSNKIPKGVELTPEVAARSETKFFQVTMHANFDKLTAGNWQTEEFKTWTNQLFSSLNDALHD